MKTKQKYWVAVDIILIAAVVVSFLVAKTSVFQQKRELPVFIGQEIAVQKAGTAMRAREVTKAKVMKATKAVTQPAPEPKIAQALPIMPPRVTFQVLPQYPEGALEAGLQGTTLLSVQVALDGTVRDLQVKTTSGAAELDKAAIASVAQWKFSPATQGGQAIASRFEIPVRFVLQ